MNTLSMLLDIPNKTPVRAPVSVRDTATLPVLVGGEVIIPPGCAGLVGVRLSHRGHPVVPGNGLWLTGNGRTVSWEGALLMAGPPFELLLEGYNLDDTYTHRIEVLIRLNDIRALRR